MCAGKGRFYMNLIPGYFQPVNKPIEWKKYIHDAENRWNPESSSMELACCWQSTPADFPLEVKLAFDRSGTAYEFLMGIPEYKVDMPGEGLPASNNLLVLSTVDHRLCPIIVEGNKNGTFGEYCDHKSLQDKRHINRRKLMFADLGLSEDSFVPGKLRYQLMHRTLSAIYVAQSFCADRCMVLVHRISHDPEGHDAYADYKYFLGLFGVDAQKGIIQRCRIAGLQLMFLWVEDRNTYTPKKSAARNAKKAAVKEGK